MKRTIIVLLKEMIEYIARRIFLIITRSTPDLFRILKPYPSLQEICSVTSYTCLINGH